MNGAVATGGISGALVAVGIWGVKTVHPEIDVPPEIAAAMTTIVSAFSAWASGPLRRFLS
jgi:hypothetical protein